ncbi:MAG TPA: hypothetical protein VKE51_04820 [Vicinamibacterales bacterium]|nr:hypothetical protein [Vicinamibacterales bacterium]
MTSAPIESFTSIGGVTFRVACDDPRLASPGDGSLEPFAVPPTNPDVDIRARWTAAPDAVRGRLVFDSGATWQLWQADSEFLFTFRSSTGSDAPYKTARLNARFTTGDVLVSSRHVEAHGSDDVYALQYPLDELLMIHQLARGLGVEIHGCAVLDAARRAFVFAGQSGAGKSTMARLWVERPDATLLSDERVVLRTDGDRITAYGTPWHGDARLTSPRCGELAAVFFLHHGTSHTCSPVGASLSAAKLLACAFLPFHSADGVDRTMSALERVARDVPCRDLWFVPDRSAVDALAPYLR